MEVKIKKLHEKAVIPTYAKYSDAGLDLTAVSSHYDNDGNIVYGTGLAIEIPYGYVGLIFPRSSNTKKDLILGNSVAVIDSSYRGEIVLKYKYGVNCEKSLLNAVCAVNETNHNKDVIYRLPAIYEVGERVGQLIIIPYPQIEFVEVGELSITDRGNKGFGSTGK